MVASDNKPSARTAEAYITVIVIRNPNAPVCTQKNSQLEMSEYEQLNKALLRITATDMDAATVCYHWFIAVFMTNVSLLFILWRTVKNVL